MDEAPPQPRAKQSAATKADRYAGLDAARAVALAAHAAAGLAASLGDAQAARLLRIAEAMGRSAHASLLRSLAAGVRPPPTTGTPAEGMGQAVVDEKEKKKRRRRRKRKQAKEGPAMVGEELGDVGMGDTVASITARAAPGGSVLVGDLGELGVSGQVLTLPPPFAAPPAAAPTLSTSASLSVAPVATSVIASSSCGGGRAVRSLAEVLGLQEVGMLSSDVLQRHFIKLGELRSEGTLTTGELQTHMVELARATVQSGLAPGAG